MPKKSDIPDVEMKCYCGVTVFIPYVTIVDGAARDGNYHEGVCPGCSMILSAGVYDAS